MKRNLIIGTILATAVGVTAVSVAAKEGGKMGQHGRDMMSFEQLDTDGDGFVTAEDLSAQSAIRFDGLDANDDDTISREELLAHAKSNGNARMEKGLEKMFARMDANKDGVLSEDEMKPRKDRSSRMIEKMDTDKDGKISKAEFDAAVAEHASKRTAHKQEKFQNLDTDGDGVISQEEWDAAKEMRGGKKGKRGQKDDG